MKPAEKSTVLERKIPVLFKWQDTVLDHYSGVALSGTFNEWDKQPMKYCDNEYVESIGTVTMISGNIDIR